MSDLRIKEENKWELESAIYDLVRNAIKCGLIGESELNNLLEYYYEVGNK